MKIDRLSDQHRRGGGGSLDKTISASPRFFGAITSRCNEQKIGKAISPNLQSGFQGEGGGEVVAREYDIG